MHIPLYQALKPIKISDEQSAEVVTSFEEYVTVKISEANKGLEAKYTSLESEIRSTKWVIGFVGTMLAIIGLAPVISKLL
jgi:hypothetical protein